MTFQLEKLLTESSLQVILTIWGSNAENFAKNKAGCIIALKRGRVMKKSVKCSLDASCLASCTYLVTFNAGNLSCSRFNLLMKLQVDPDIPQSHLLREWAKRS